MFPIAEWLMFPIAVDVPNRGTCLKIRLNIQPRSSMPLASEDMLVLVAIWSGGFDLAVQVIRAMPLLPPRGLYLDFSLESWSNKASKE